MKSRRDLLLPAARHLIFTKDRNASGLSERSVLAEEAQVAATGQLPMEDR
jgi:hypothetical protein